MWDIFKKKPPVIVLKKGDMVHLKDGNWDGLDKNCGFSVPVISFNSGLDVSLKTNKPYVVFYVGEDPRHMFIEVGDIVARIYEWQIDIEKTKAIKK